MKNITCTLLVILAFGIPGIKAQDLVGLSHKQVFEYWQKKVPAEQLNDNDDLLVINGSSFCSFKKKICVDFTTTIAASELEKYKADLNANKELHYDAKTETWINDIKKFAWKLTKVGENDYELSCKKL